jgi:hypothetical protein
MTQGKQNTEVTRLSRRRLPVAIPEVVYAGDPSEVYPYRWAVVRWLDGVDASDARHHEDWLGADLGHWPPSSGTCAA